MSERLLKIKNLGKTSLEELDSTKSIRIQEPFRDGETVELRAVDHSTESLKEQLSRLMDGILYCSDGKAIFGHIYYQDGEFKGDNTLSLGMYRMERRVNGNVEYSPSFLGLTFLATDRLGRDSTVFVTSNGLFGEHSATGDSMLKRHPVDIMEGLPDRDFYGVITDPCLYSRLQGLDLKQQGTLEKMGSLEEIKKYVGVN